MLKRRLIAIANLVKKDATVIDVGTDHAYLPIYLYQNNITKKVIGTDISQHALEGAQKNLAKAKITDIKLIWTDGLNNINEEYDTLILSGMGTNTIIKILTKDLLPQNIIISSNNELYKLRKFMNKIGYKITKEIIVLENGKYYDIIAYEKGHEHLSDIKLRFGKSNDQKYYRYLYQTQKEIFRKANFKRKITLLKDLTILKFLTI